MNSVFLLFTTAVAIIAEVARNILLRVVSSFGILAVVTDTKGQIMVLYSEYSCPDSSRTSFLIDKKHKLQFLCSQTKGE
jgi:hypothetical protein